MLSIVSFPFDGFFCDIFILIACDHNSIDVAVEPAFETKQLCETMIDIISFFPVKGVSMDLPVFFEIMVVMFVFQPK